MNYSDLYGCIVTQLGLRDGILFTMDISAAIILGLVQGITEFLPISSTGHLVLVEQLLSLNMAQSLAVGAVFHLATTLAVVTYFRGDLWVLLQALIRKLGRLPTNEKDLTLLYALLVGTIPAVVLGLLLEGYMEAHFQTPQVVATLLFVGAIFFMYAEWRYFLSPPRGAITVRRGLLVGLFQALALLPGISRSGATLAGGMLLGLSRLEAARFSFLLAIPITLGVGIKKLLDLMVIEGDVVWLPIMIGAAMSFVSALIVIHYFLAFIRRYTLWPFIWYSITLSCLVGYVAFFA
jgi:undecaprenyl-diphosphatase